MEVGVVLRNMGPQSTRETLEAVARAADALPAVADVWVVDHIAIPPDDAEGSDGRYLDPLATLAYLAGTTTRVGLGTAVLVLPYRPALPTAKWIATVQELSGGRLRLGVGVGWMGAEFRAVGVDHRRRGALTDETLAFLDRCFAADVVEANGQPFLFRPRPPRPPLFIGGAPPHAFRRAPAARRRSPRAGRRREPARPGGRRADPPPARRPRRRARPPRALRGSGRDARDPRRALRGRACGPRDARSPGARGVSLRAGAGARGRPAARRAGARRRRAGDGSSAPGGRAGCGARGAPP